MARVGLDEGISRQPDSLLHQVNLIHDHLTAPNLTLPEAALAEPGPDPVVLAAFLEPERHLAGSADGGHLSLLNSKLYP